MALRSAAGHQPIHQDLVIIADSFGTLQAARHDADYNGNYDPVRASAMNHIDDAEAALKANPDVVEGPRVLSANQGTRP